MEEEIQGMSCLPPLRHDPRTPHRLPGQLSKILNAAPRTPRHSRARGIRVAVIDSGFYPHPFYESRGYRISRVPTRDEPDPHIDEYGHGTAQLASLLAIAPEVEVFAIKCLDKDPSYSLRKAIHARSGHPDLRLGLQSRQARERKNFPPSTSPSENSSSGQKKGICVVAAAGNGQFAFPGNMPEVISAGGVYYTPEGEFRAFRRRVEIQKLRFFRAAKFRTSAGSSEIFPTEDCFSFRFRPRPDSPNGPPSE